MSAPVLQFTPRAELGPQENLAAFVALCKQSEVLNARGQFESDVWDIGHQKGKNGLLRAVFSTLEASQTASPIPAFPALFLDFAKATLVYLQDRRPVVSVGPRVTALRCLEAALREWNKGSRPTAVNVEILDTAVELARNRLTPDVAYRVAGQLEMIADLMHTHGFIVLRQPWRHGMKKPNALGSRISKESLQARQDKLPSAAALRALAGIFRDAVRPMDILVSSYTALMLCAPERINEVLRVRRDCLVEGEGRFTGKLGLRWSGSKGADDTTKWLPTQMISLAREALSNLLKVTGPANEIAAWYTAYPDTLFIHEGASHLRGQEVLSLADLALLLWGDERATNPANTWAQKTNHLSPVALAGRHIGYRFDEVQRAVLTMLPSTFPYVPGAPDLLCKDALAVIRANESHETRATYLCMFGCADYQVLTNALGGRESCKSIFARFDYQEDDGTPIALRSHSLRHYLNMLAQMGGLSSAEIAIFSGRKDVRQNRAYDHRTSDEVQVPISMALKAGFTGDLVVAGSRDLISRDEFLGMGLVAAHTTEFGWCSHNFASEPCQMFRDCINCEEQVCTKGDAHKEANLRSLEKETEYLLQQAKDALSEEEYGADNWVKHQTKTLDRVKGMLAILTDPSVPAGTRIRLDLANAPLITANNLQPINLSKRLETVVKAEQS
jgi:hypothetical protein